MIMYITYPKKSIKISLELTSEFDKVTGYEFNIQKINFMSIYLKGTI